MPEPQHTDDCLSVEPSVRCLGYGGNFVWAKWGLETNVKVTTTIERQARAQGQRPDEFLAAFIAEHFDGDVG